MKVAIITLYDNSNYGNRLQNYALYRSISSYKIEVTTLLHEKTRVNGIKKIAKLFLKRENGEIVIKGRKDRVDEKRQAMFILFNKKYLSVSFCKRKEGVFTQELNDEYDFFLAGSDQIWNPFLWYPGDPIHYFDNFFVCFAPSEKRIAYAPSIGCREIPMKWKALFAEELQKFKAISVREESGARIIKNLINKKIPVVLDPTLLLTAQEWRKIETYNLPYNKRYILTYFLGPQPENVKEEIYQKAEESGAEVVEMMDWHSPYYMLGPDGFLEMIDHAQAVFTDSFHGTVFCILFHKPFYVYSRYLDNLDTPSNMESRVDTLLSKTGLTQCVREHRPPTKEEFAEADRRLQKEREKSMQFLREALEIPIE